MISEAHLYNLTNLFSLSVSSLNKSLAFKIGHDWTPPLSLNDVGIDNCELGPSFPAWLRTQTELDKITLKNAGISDAIPSWFWKLSRCISWLDLSNNELSGELPQSIDFSPALYLQIQLGFNRLEGSVPLWPNVTYLSLRDNLLSGPIPPNIGHNMSKLKTLDLSGNSLNGTIPPSITKMKSLDFLDLSSNQLSGSLLDQWKGLEMLQVLDLSNNHLSGLIPSSMCSQLLSLYWLRLSGNDFSGDFPLSLHNCTFLFALDLGENRFSGTIPSWIHEDLRLLNYLSLRSNMFHGNIPHQLCNFKRLHVLDLAHNNFSGHIPKCLGISSLPLQIPQSLYLWPPSTQDETSEARLKLMVKGRIVEYTTIISIVNLIDLSSNDLSGRYRKKWANLSRLGYLNLSRNQLTGKIPQSFGKLKLLETLDLSWNGLSGAIPPSMSSMTALNHLNLSHNNLSGKIPYANQFQTFNDKWIYEGNLHLCGAPLPTNCSFSRSDENSEDASENADDKNDTLWFYASVAMGYVVGLGALCVAMLMNTSLRHAYFKLADAVEQKITLFIATNMVRLRRRTNMSPTWLSERGLICKSKQ